MHVILGGGIAGLYNAWTCPPEHPVLLVEANEHFGGRFWTETVDDITFEAGASIMHDRQELYRLAITLGCTPIPLPKSKILRRQTPDLVAQYLPQAHANPLRSMKEIVDPEITSDILAWHELAPQNALACLEGIKKEGNYVYLREGMTNFISRLVSALRLRPACRFLSGHRVTGISFDANVVMVDGHQIIPYDTLHIALGKNDCTRLSYLPTQLVDLCALVRTVPTIRFYCVFEHAKDLDSIMNGWDQVVGLEEMGWVLRTGTNKLMLAYTDDTLAEHVHNQWTEKGSLVIEPWIRRLIERTGGQVRSLPLFLKVYFWTEGFCILHPYISVSLYHHARQSTLPKNVTESILPNEYGQQQAWAESHLISFEQHTSPSP